MFVEASEWHYRERDRTTLQREGQNYSHKTSTGGTSIYWFNIQSLSTRLLRILPSTCNHCMHAETVFTGLPPINMQSLSTCGNCIHWSTSIQHAIIVYMRKLYSLVYLHSTCNHCLRAKTVFTGLPPFNMQSLSTCGNCIHWSTSIQHAIIVYMRKLYSLFYRHPTCSHCLHAEAVSSIQYAIIFTHTYQRPPPPPPLSLSISLSMPVSSERSIVGCPWLCSPGNDIIFSTYQIFRDACHLWCLFCPTVQSLPGHVPWLHRYVITPLRFMDDWGDQNRKM